MIAVDYETEAAACELRAASAADPTNKQLFLEMAGRYRELAREARAKAAPFEPSDRQHG